MKKLTRAVFKAHIKGGKLEYENPGYMRTIIFGYDDTEKVRVIVEKERGIRTHNQNNYYWGVVLPTIAESLGYTTDELHEVFKSKFLRTRKMWRGAEMTVLKSTTQLTSDEMGEYIDRCVREGADLGIEVQPADKNWDLIETLRHD